MVKQDVKFFQDHPDFQVVEKTHYYYVFHNDGKIPDFKTEYDLLMKKDPKQANYYDRIPK